MKRANQRSVNDVLVSDPDAAMRRTAEATRHILTVPKSETAHQPVHRKTRKHKK